jgi:hypothetical protein
VTCGNVRDNIRVPPWKNVGKKEPLVVVCSLQHVKLAGVVVMDTTVGHTVTMAMAMVDLAAGHTGHTDMATEGVIKVSAGHSSGYMVWCSSLCHFSSRCR